MHLPTASTLISLYSRQKHLPPRPTELVRSPVQSCDPKGIRCPRNVAETCTSHAFQHLLRGRKALHRCGKIGVWPLHSREQGPDGWQHAFEIKTIAVANYSLGLSKVENAALPSRAQNAENLSQAG